MAGRIRIGARIVALTLLTLGMYGIRLITWPLTFAFRHVDRRWRCCLFRQWARGVAAIFGMRVRVEGAPPEPPYFMVTNHLTYMDSIVLASQLGCVFLVRGDVANWPVVGFFAKQVNMIFVDRSKRSDTVRVNDLIASTLAEGEGIVMFPESTTSRGLAVQPFKTALFQPAAESSLPVHYATLHYEAFPGSPPASEWITWWTPVTFGEHLFGVMRRNGFDARVTFGKDPITCPERKQLAEQVQAAVQAQFTPIE